MDVPFDGQQERQHLAQSVVISEFHKHVYNTVPKKIIPLVYKHYENGVTLKVDNIP